MKIRKATVQDERVLLEIHADAVRVGCNQHYSNAQIASWAVPQRLPPFAEVLTRALFLVAEADDEPVAFGSLANDRPEITCLFVRPQYFHRGIGSQVLLRLESTAKLRGQTTLTVDSSLNAVPFYARHGYVRQCCTSHTEPDGTEVPCLKMQKALG